MKNQSIIKAIVTGAACLIATPALADVGSIATTVLNELQALVGPAISLAVIWLGILIMTGRASLLAFFVLLIGIAIVASGGMF